MPDTKRPDSRFAMIALEMFPEDAPSSAMVSATTALPNDRGLVLGREVSIYPITTKQFMRAVRNEVSKHDLKKYMPLPIDADAPTQVDRTEWSSVITDRVEGARLPDGHPAIAALTRVYASVLGLDDFDAYAARRRKENNSACRTCGLSKKEHDTARGRDCENFTLMTNVNVNRRTGRTWRGILELLARCSLATRRQKVWVIDGSPQRHSRWLRNEVVSISNELGLNNPSEIEMAPSDVRRRTLEVDPPRGVMIYVDHTYYENNRRRDEFTFNLP